MEFMTPDLWVLAAATLACSALVAMFGVSEAQRFSPRRPAPRHRRRATAAEVLAEGRELAVDAGWALLGLLTLAINLTAAGTRVARSRIVQIGA